MALAIFDLDNTLLAGDSDYLWGVFLAENDVVDRSEYESANDRFYHEYQQGRLDIHEFLSFSLKPLASNPLADLLAWRSRFLSEKIDPIITASARRKVEEHRAAGDTLMIITATNAFVTAPIAERFAIPHLIATEPEFVNGAYTGRVAGQPSFREGKVQRLAQWLDQHQADLRGRQAHADGDAQHGAEYPARIAQHPAQDHARRLVENPAQALVERAGAGKIRRGRRAHRHGG